MRDFGHDIKMTAEVARRTAVEVMDYIRSGEDPFPAPEATVADLAERYMKAHVEVNCKPGTVGIFRRVVDLYILPELGALKISAVGHKDSNALIGAITGRDP